MAKEGFSFLVYAILFLVKKYRKFDSYTYAVPSQSRIHMYIYIQETPHMMQSRPYIIVIDFEEYVNYEFCVCQYIAVQTSLTS